ncbi:hypothetical protein SDRG_03998 [Saprolegnia diclina VS20]|uniref:F-box domain-containing protein n=1 Tax=Saprolegnia diclina (strain VS20) TaxID=1156394 RepID=T0QYC2_SAPDV|nr:hypothetical protein SDRG_03998 [Saprolegnia diclina VS20]EQC39045.1 hypothetical protein SDRG_03998 [Saprolegnia diclina VS20]|eukprot:XP_008607869.1 hypothetical protein SDRG_03998 [Saprolegnia diclina VS20]
MVIVGSDGPPPPKRAKPTTSAGCLLTGALARHVMGYLRDATDVKRFLQVLPRLRDDAPLQSLLALLQRVHDPSIIWPIASLSDLYAPSASCASASSSSNLRASAGLDRLVQSALPLLRQLQVNAFIATPPLARYVPLMANTTISALLGDLRDFEATYGLWAPHITSLSVTDPTCETWPHLCRTLALCPRLQSLTYFVWRGSETYRHVKMDVSWFAAYMMTQSSLATVHLTGLPLTTEAAASVGDALLSSSTMTTLNVHEMPQLLCALGAATLSLSPQLTSLHITAVDYHAADNIASVALKLQTSRVRTLEVRTVALCNLTRAATALATAPMLQSLTLVNGVLGDLTPLRSLRHLHLSSMRLSRRAITAIAHLMATSECLVSVKLDNCYHDQHDDKTSPFLALTAAMPVFFGRAGQALAMSVHDVAVAAGLTSAMHKMSTSTTATLELHATALPMTALRDLVSAITCGTTLRLVVRTPASAEALLAHATRLQLRAAKKPMYEWHFGRPVPDIKYQVACSRC